MTNKLWKNNKVRNILVSISILYMYQLCVNSFTFMFTRCDCALFDNDNLITSWNHTRLLRRLPLFFAVNLLRTQINFQIFKFQLSLYSARVLYDRLSHSVCVQNLPTEKIDSNLKFANTLSRSHRATNRGKTQDTHHREPAIHLQNCMWRWLTVSASEIHSLKRHK